MKGQSDVDDTALETLFRRARTHPGKRFYERMAQAPWAVEPCYISAQKRRRSFALTVVGIAGVLLFVLAVPLKSLAQQAFDYIFRGESDTVSSPVFVEPTAISPVLQDLADLQRVSQMVGFQVRLPIYLPESLQITDVNVHARSVLITYSNEDATLIFLQQSDATASLYVGATAEVEVVFVDGVTGEFVRGGWAQTERGLIWDNNLNGSHLLWEKDGVRYSLTAESGELSLETLLMIANRLP